LSSHNKVAEEKANNNEVLQQVIYWFLYSVISDSREPARVPIVTWDLGGNVPHIGILVETKSSQSGRYMIVHNIGRGPKMEDVLFDWKITGHYSYGEAN
jgi:uncharacterized protein YijF (DUF1287 family)